jgi:hypothetical protein
MVRRIAVGLLGRQRHDSIDACGSLNIEYPEGAEHLGMASRRNVELIQRPQIATPNRMAAATEDVSADVVLTEIKTRVGGRAQ